jgi:glycosyltransferase involved in cell wall biosynthesis
MKVCIDARKILDFGIGTYIRNLLEQFALMENNNEYYLIFEQNSNEAAVHNSKNFHIIEDRSPKYSLSEHFSIPRHLKKYDVDLYHSPHYVTPLVKTKPTVVTIHDLIHLLFPQYLPRPYRLALFYARFMVANSIRHADKIITDSEWSKKDIQKYFKVSENKIRVIYLGIDTRFHQVDSTSCRYQLQAKYKIDRDYLLYVGSFRKHKNMVNLVKAFKIVDKKYCPYLVLVGDSLEKNEELRPLIDELGLTERIIIAEQIGVEELNNLYNGAELFVFPSLYEGFGLPPLEAMKCSTPVVASHASCIPEILGEAACYFDPHNVNDMAQKIENVLRDESYKHELIEKGKKRATEFSWSKTAEETLRIYREVV